MKSPVTLMVATSVALLTAPCRAQVYSITDLQPGSGFADAMAYGVSQNGKITGAGTVTATGEVHAFIYSNGVFQDLGMLGFPGGAYGMAVNNSGQVAATGYGPGYQALLYSNGHAAPIGNIDGGSTVGLAMNKYGHIVGRARNGDGGYQGFSYLGSFDALNVDVARGINDADQIVGSFGFVWNTGGKFVYVFEHGFVMQGATMTDIGDLGGGRASNTEAYAINNAGQITGYSTRADGATHAFVWTNGAMTDLGALGGYSSFGTSINNRGEVIGNLGTSVYNAYIPFLYTHGAMHYLTDLLDASGAGWSGLVATQINDSGWIVGYGTINGATHGFLARPASVCPGDANGDNTVNFADLNIVLGAFGMSGQGLPGDVNHDGVVNFTDLNIVLAYFGTGC